MVYKSELISELKLKNFKGLVALFKAYESTGAIKCEVSECDSGKTCCTISILTDCQLTPTALECLAENFMFFSDGTIFIDEKYWTWSEEDTKCLARFLAPYLKNGSKMIFYDEYSHRWGYIFKKKKAYELYWKEKVGIRVK